MGDKLSGIAYRIPIYPSLPSPHSHSIGRGVAGDVVGDPVDAAHLVDDAGRGAAEDLVREGVLVAVMPSVGVTARSAQTKSSDAGVARVLYIARLSFCQEQRADLKERSCLSYPPP